MKLLVKCISFFTLFAALIPCSAQTVGVQKYDDPAQQVAWIAYGTGLATYVQKHISSVTLPAGRWEPTFEAEVTAREYQVTVWKELLQKEKFNYPFMSQMLDVSNAGYMKEYVWTYYKKPSWIQPAELKLPEFTTWSEQHLQSHKPETGAQIVIQAK